MSADFDEQVAYDFIDIITTLNLCVAVHEVDNQPIGKINKQLIKTCKVLTLKYQNRSLRQVLKNIIKAPFPAGQLARIHREIDNAYDRKTLG